MRNYNIPSTITPKLELFARKAKKVSAVFISPFDEETARRHAGELPEIFTRFDFGLDKLDAQPDGSLNAVIFYHFFAWESDVQRVVDVVELATSKLKEGGRFVIVEEMPPDNKFHSQYTQVVRAGHPERNVFVYDHLFNLLSMRGYSNVQLTGSIEETYPLASYLGSEEAVAAAKAVLDALDDETREIFGYNPAEGTFVTNYAILVGTKKGVAKEEKKRKVRYYTGDEDAAAAQ